MASGFTTAGSAGMVAALHAGGARIALFTVDYLHASDDDRVTDWQPYDSATNVGVAVPVGAPTRYYVVRVEALDGKSAFWWWSPTPLAAGDLLAPPDPGLWFSGASAF